MTPGLLARLVEGAQVRSGTRAMATPMLVRALARWAPIIAVPGGRVFVWRYDDVRRVLEHDHDMGVVYMARMRELGAPFFLGLDDSAEYRLYRGALHSAMRFEDLPWIARLSTTSAERLLGAAGDRIDAVGELTDSVIAEALDRYLGIGRLDGDQLDGARAVFQYVFIGRYSRRANRAAAQAARLLSARLDDEIADRRAALDRGRSPRDDVLDRLLTAGELDELGIRNTVLGVVVAWVANVSRSLALALDGLLARPRELARARQAAQAGDERRVGAFLLEALRFRTPTPVLLRRCARTTTVGSRRIPLGRQVVAVVATAMMDSRQVAAPRRFRVERPAMDVLHFGTGLHRCFGEPIACVQMAAIATALLRRGDPRRARSGGHLAWDGPFPARLGVEFSVRG